MNKNTKIIICCGINRSGSTWSYQVCKDILSKGNMLDLSYVDKGNLKNAIESNHIDNYDSVLIKMHAYDPYIEKLAQEFRIYHLYTHRDIRGCLYSLATKTGKPIDTFIKIPFFESSINSFSSWQTVAPIHYTPYLDIMNNSEKAVAEILAFIEEEGDEKFISEKFKVENQKKRITNYTTTPSGFIMSMLVKLGIKPIAKDEESLLHSNHINTKTADEWKDNMTVRKSELIKKSYSEWMNFFGYE